ncbi:MAG: NAD(P)-dependent oxidoreductase [Gammaproteobacteria bacterium]|nr:NAD(P)-dependent oxidoreductase [Gammaproteobacteria bacterium]
MKLLVTGASGFLGQRLCRCLSRSHDITALYASHKPALPGVAWWRYRHGTDAAEALPTDIEGIVHLAQSAQYRDFPNGADDMFGVNVDFLFRLLEHARKCGVSTFVDTSTGGVYEGASAPFGEALAVTPRNFYAASKLAGEVLCQPYRELFPVAVLRLFFIYGPGQIGRLVPNLAERIRCGHPVDLTGANGGLRITPTYVDDVVDVIATALEERWDGIFNVASDEVISIEELARHIGRLLGREPVFRRNEGKDPGSMVPDLTALRAQFDMSRFRCFADAVADALPRG